MLHAKNQNLTSTDSLVLWITK